jgi:hypothetical protein
MAAGKPAARVQVRGAAEFRKAMKGMGADLKDLTAANKEAAKTVLEAAKENSPVLSGQLRASGRAKATRTSGRVMFGGSTVPYAGVIHFGWPAHGISPNPFMYDAADDRADEVAGAYQAAIDKMIRKVERVTPP